MAASGGLRGLDLTPQLEKAMEMKINKMILKFNC